MTQTIQLDKTSSLLYNETYLPEEQADELLEHMLQDIPWRKSQIKLFGKSIDVPRLQCWMSDDGIDVTDLYQKEPAIPWSPQVLRIKKSLEKLTGRRFNYVLLNYYRNGKDSISFHSDKEAIDDDKNIVASISVGATRSFILKPKDVSLKKHKYALKHGALIVMQGDTQKGWTHGVPKQQNVTEPRVNLTFRTA